MTKYNCLPVSEYFTNRNIHSKLYIIFQYYLPTLYRYLWWRCSKGKGSFYWPDGKLWIDRTPSIITLPTGLWCRYRTTIVIIMIIIIMILIIAIIMIEIIITKIIITIVMIIIIMIVILVIITIFNFQLSANYKIIMVQCRTCAVQYKFTRYTPLPLPSLIFPTWMFSCISFCFTILLLLLFLLFFFLFYCLIAFNFALIFPFSFAFIPQGQECIATAGEVSLAETASMPQQMSMTICTNIPYVPY